ncbi:MAG: hypothetical protein GY929_16680 [Actinomycetia bacterium]|nr:hypothetical protein [Actinomycetes bacterium]
MTRSSTSLFLRLFVASVVANAVLGIWALLSGDFGETQGKVLGTSFLVSAAMLSVLVNGPAARRQALWPAPLVGAVAGASGFALFTVFLWIEPDDGGWFKLAGSALVIAGAATLASSLALIALPVRVRWLQTVSIAVIALLGSTIVAGLWAEPDAGWYARLLGIEGVLVASMTLLIPVLARFSSSQQPATSGEATPAGPSMVRFCPSCGRPVAHSTVGTNVATVCDECGLTFEVRVTPETGTASSTDISGGEPVEG